MAPAKKNQLSTENALASVQVYMQQQYRPYSVSDILLNMHNVLTKPKLITILDTLVADQQLVCKTIGKASYIECLNQQIKDLKQEICHLKLKLQEIVTTPTNEELDNLIEVYTKKIENLSLELEKCRHNTS
ncbi:Tat binding protein 1(TBP-1)-interacting protein (TBPIP) family protein [Candida albicans]|uniref:Tat binding protein 1(TBP-1)-interacting protein (TBPIP) family protein n=1 Tax=Candida albicans TaxID=5476 RepID=A0A8H6C4Z6_CANAX|nr:Tat binding protein 1(TBP-1)-interacting protein (TBPIP) family protein [Candida albicans]